MMTVPKKFTLRIPDDLHDQLAQMAKEDMRSLHAFILVLLKEATQKREAALRSKEQKDAQG